MIKTIITTAVIILFFSANLLAKKEWVQKHYVEKENITTLQCVDSLNCYAFVDDARNWTNRIYKSIDQGNTWQLIYEYDNSHEPDILALNRCFASDTLNIIISYKNIHYIDKSTDGGKTFKRIKFIGTIPQRSRQDRQTR